MFGIINLFRGSESSLPSMHVLDSGEPPSKMAKSFLQVLKSYNSEKTPEKLNEVCQKVHSVWMLICDIEREVAPQRKFELAEELFIRSEIFKNLLIVFRIVVYESKKKIRDIINFMCIWCANDADDCSFPRNKMNKAKQNSFQVRDQMILVKNEISRILTDGYDEPDSVALYNDIIRLFVADQQSHEALLAEGSGSQWTPTGGDCFWTIFTRLNTPAPRQVFDAQFDITFHCFDTLKILLSGNNKVVENFLQRNWKQFACEMSKLMVSMNFWIQTSVMELLLKILCNRHMSKQRDIWLDDVENLRIVTLNMQSNTGSVRSAAISLLELFIQNPNITSHAYDFILANRVLLIKYFWQLAPVHMYDGSMDELDDSMYSKIVARILDWNLERPLTSDQMKEFLEEEERRQRMFEEMTTKTRDANFEVVPGNERVMHVFRYRRPILLTTPRRHVTGWHVASENSS